MKSMSFPCGASGFHHESGILLQTGPGAGKKGEIQVRRAVLHSTSAVLSGVLVFSKAASSVSSVASVLKYDGAVFFFFCPPPRGGDWI